MSISYWLDKASSKAQVKDIVIIGGGIAGLSAAYWLHKEDPSLKIALVEKRDLGYGATGRNAGFITCGSVEHFSRLVEKHGKDEAQKIWNFSEKNLELLKEHIIKDNHKQLLFENAGSFSLASTENEYKELINSSKLMQKMGINVELVDGEGVKKRTGALGFVGGIKYLDDASVHPIKLLEEIKKNIGSDVSFYEGHEVYSIETQGESKLVKTAKANFSCSLVVFATNGYSPLLNTFFSDKIFPTRGQILITESVERFMEAPCYANFVLDYFRQLPTGQMIIGGFRQLKKDVEVGYSDETTDVIQHALERFLDEHIPAVKGKKITHRWSGIMGFSVDGQPLVGAFPTDPQFYFLGGFTAHGLGLAFHCGKVLADSIFGRSIPEYISARRLT